MSSKIVGWLVGVWDGKFQIYLKNLKNKKYSEINLKKGNPTFLPDYTFVFSRPAYWPVVPLSCDLVLSVYQPAQHIKIKCWNGDCWSTTMFLKWQNWVDSIFCDLLFLDFTFSRGFLLDFHSACANPWILNGDKCWLFV